MIRLGALIVRRGIVTFARSWRAQLWLTTDDALPTSPYIVSEDGVQWQGIVTATKASAGSRYVTMEGAPELLQTVAPKSYRQTNLRAVLTHTLSQAGLTLDPNSDETALITRVRVHVRSWISATEALNALGNQYNFTWHITPGRTVRINPPKTDVTGLIAVDESGPVVHASAPGFVALPTQTYKGSDVGLCIYEVDEKSMQLEMYT